MKSSTQLKPMCGRFARAAAMPALAVVALSAAPLSVSFAESTPALVEASIPFANYGGIRDWQPDRDRGLWVQSVHRKWYYARFMGSCLGLNFATAIGFDTHPLGSFDRWSTVIVPRYGRCTIQSLSLSDGPPKKVKKSKGAASEEGSKASASTESSEVILSNPEASELATIDSAGIEPVTINLARIDPAKGDSSPQAK